MIQDYIDAGRIVNTHGVRGEVKIEVWLDSPEMLAACRRLFIGNAERRILASREHQGFLIAALEGIGDMNAAMALKGRTVRIYRGDAKLPEGGYFLQDLLGASVRNEDGTPVGTLSDILERPASNIYVVTDAGGREHLIPAVPAFVLSCDPAAGEMTVRLIGGM